MSTDIKKIASKLQKNPIFSSCSSRNLTCMVSNMIEKKLNAGDILYKSHMTADYLYLILDGKIKLVSDKQIVKELEGGLLGEEAGIDEERYMSDAIAISPSTVIGIPKESIKTLLEKEPKLIKGFYASLFDHFTNQKLSGGSLRNSIDFEEKNIDVWKIIGWILSILLPAGVWFFSSGSELDWNSRLFLTVLSAAIVMWVFALTFSELVPCIFLMLVMLLLGIAPMSVVLSGFTSGSFFMAMSVFGLAVVLIASGITNRIIFSILKHLPKSRFFYSVGIFLIGLLLTPIVPSQTGRASITTPLLIDMTEVLNYKKGGKAATELAACTYAGFSLFSIVFLSGASFNFFIFGFLPLQVREQFSWGYWALASMVVTVALVVLTIVSSTILYRSNEIPKISKEKIEAQIEMLGPITTKEWAAIVGISIFIIGLITQSIHMIATPWIGMAVLYFFLALGVLSKEEFQKDINWSFLIYLGGLIGIVKTISYLELNNWLSGYFLWMGKYMQESFLLFVLILSISVVFVQLFIPYSTTVAIFATIFLPLAQQNGINPWLIGFIILLMGDGWIMPHQCSNYLLFRELTKKKQIFDERSVLIFNGLTVLFRLMAIYISIPYWRLLGLL